MTLNQYMTISVVIAAFGIGCTGCSERTVVDAVPLNRPSQIINADPHGAASTDSELPSYLHLDHFAMLEIDVQRLTSQDELKAFDWQQIFRQTAEPLGEIITDFNQVETLTLLMDQEFFSLVPTVNDTTPSPPSSIVTVICAAGKLDRQRLNPDYQPKPENADLYLDRANRRQVWFVDELTLVAGSPETVDKLAREHASNPELYNSGSRRGHGAIQGLVNISPIRPTLRMPLRMAQGMAPEAGSLVDLLNALLRFEFEIDLVNSTSLRATFFLTDGELAKSLAGQFRAAADSLSAGVAQWSKMQKGSSEAMLRPSQSMKRMPQLVSEVVAGGIAISQQGNQVVVQIPRPDNLDQFLAALVEDARFQTGLARRMEQLETIARALVTYQRTEGRLPAANWVPNGSEHAFSWRVALLSGLGHQALFDQFDFSQPWDSEDNLKVARTVPEVFNSRFSATCFAVVTGLDGGVPGEMAEDAADIPDGESETAMLIEIPAEDRAWIAPGGVEYAQGSELPPLGLPGENGILAAMFTGEIRIISRKEDSQVRAVLSARGGETISTETWLRRDLD